MPRHLAAFALLLLSTAACHDGGPVAPPEPEPAAQLAVLDCTVTMASGALACTSPAPGVGEAEGLIVGGQGTRVYLEASNHSYDPGNDRFSMDVTVQNLIPQALGTADGVTRHADAVRVFFSQDPTASDGSGLPVSVFNHHGTDFFLTADQKYFKYDQIIHTDQTSDALNWQFTVADGVASFNFKVYVAAQVQFPQGWIDVTPPADTMAAGGVQPLTATVRRSLGDPLAGQTVTWETSDPGIATIDASGVVTGVAPGTATITATSGVRSGTATIAVCPDLEVGEVYTASMPAASALCFAGGASESAEYTYMPVNLSSSSALSLSVTGAGIVAVTGPPTPSLAPAGTLPSNGLERGEEHRLEQGDAFHVEMMERDRELAQDLLRRPGTRVNRARRSGGAGGGPRRLIVPGMPAVGDLWSLNVASGCSGALDLRAGRVVSVGQHVVVVADTMNPPGGFTQAQYDSIQLEFDSLAYPVDTANFGGPSDLDGNQRVVAFYTRAVNERTPTGRPSITAGYFESRDLFSSAPGGCPRSNEGEIFYLLVPDPAGVVNGNARTVSFVRGTTLGLMTHELQHLINASRRIYLHNANLEAVWLDEGLSHIAEELLFYRTSAGLAPRGNIVFSQLSTGPDAALRMAAFNTYATQNFGRLRRWLQRPDTAGPFKTNSTLATRGAVWAFLRYAADRLDGDDPQLWFDLVNTTSTGLANLQGVLGTDPLVWVRDFTSAMYTDDAITGIGPEQQVTSWNFRSIYTELDGSYVLGPHPLSNGVALTLSYSRGGATAYTRFAVPAGGFAGITALSNGVVPTSPYALIVVRTR